MTKHDQIMRYIESLKIGSTISVRQLAKDMSVSEGTAYRAMKEARELGLLVSRERIGTIRVEKLEHDNLQQLTFADVANIVDGRVLGGAAGLAKTLNKFVIGAMTQEAMMSYITPDSLLIVGNRDEAHICALEQGAGVLITGGFAASDAVIKLADRFELPIISSHHDTYTVASIINRAMYDRLIKKKMMLIEHLPSIQYDVQVLKPSDTVQVWHDYAAATGSHRFPVVDDRLRVIGIVTSRDIIGADAEQSIDQVMTRQPLTIQMQTPIATAAHLVVWEGVNALPIVNAQRKLIGMISRADILKAMQYIQSQPQLGETIDELIWSEFVESRDEQGQLSYRGKIIPQMTSAIGIASEGVLTILLTQAAYSCLRQYNKAHFVLDNMTTYFMSPVQLEAEIVIRPQMIEVSRKFGKISVHIYHQEKVVCQAMLTAQVIDLL